MEYNLEFSGVCSKGVSFELDGNIVKNIRFKGGCPGNTTGVARLANGRPIEELIEILSGTKCRAGNGITSCPDQFSKGLANALECLNQKSEQQV